MGLSTLLEPLLANAIILRLQGLKCNTPCFCIILAIALPPLLLPCRGS